MRFTAKMICFTYKLSTLIRKEHHLWNEWSCFVRLLDGEDVYYYRLLVSRGRIWHNIGHSSKGRKLKLCSGYELIKDTHTSSLRANYEAYFLGFFLEKRYREISRGPYILIPYMDTIILYKQMASIKTRRILFHYWTFFSRLIMLLQSFVNTHTMRRPAEFIITGYVGSPGSLAVRSCGENIFEEYGSPALVFFKFIWGVYQKCVWALKFKSS